MEVNGSSCRRINENPSELRQRIRVMEEDQEELNNSLMALTSHFAKVTQTKLFFLIQQQMTLLRFSYHVMPQTGFKLMSVELHHDPVPLEGSSTD